MNDKLFIMNNQNAAGGSAGSIRFAWKLLREMQYNGQ